MPQTCRRDWPHLTSRRLDEELDGYPLAVALALQADGWLLRSDIIWHKPNPMPESVRDRPTKSHEYLFMFSKSQRYHWDQDAVREPSRQQRARRLECADAGVPRRALRRHARASRRPVHPCRICHR